MRTVVFSFVQNDMALLELWLSYYRRHFDDLKIYCFNTKEKYIPRLNRLKKKYKMEYEFLEEFKGDKIDGTPSVFLGFVREKQIELLREYDWVLVCNLDEIIVPKRGMFEELMRRRLEEWVAIPSEGYEVIQTKREKPIDYNKSYFKQRKYWIKNNNYNKILLSRIPILWSAGLHKIDTMTDEESKNIKNTPLYLVHLKHADLEAKRDFGPYRASLDPNIVEHWGKYKKPIPKQIRKAL